MNVDPARLEELRALSKELSEVSDEMRMQIDECDEQLRGAGCSVLVCVDTPVEGQVLAWAKYGDVWRLCARRLEPSPLQYEYTPLGNVSRTVRLALCLQLPALVDALTAKMKTMIAAMENL